MKEIIKLGLVLFLTCFIAALLLAGTYEVTKETISDQRTLKNELAKKDVLPTASKFEDVDPGLLQTYTETFYPLTEIYVGLTDNNEIAGYVFKSLPVGFAGNMEVVVGIDSNGIVTGLRVGNHQETPGLGAKAKDVAFYEQYVGKSASEWIGVSKLNSDNNDIQAITGATITSDSVTLGANASIDAYKKIVSEGGIQ